MTRRIDALVDGLTEVVDPSVWAGIDSARIRAGGSWTDVKTIRVRQADNVLEDKDFTVIEVTVKYGEVVGIRVLQLGVYSHVLQRGPFLFWTLDLFTLWLAEETHDVEGRVGYKQIWVKNKWAGVQESLHEAQKVFTS